MGYRLQNTSLRRKVQPASKQAATLQALPDAAAQSELPLREVAIVALLADTGLRRTELATLRVEQVQWLGPDGERCLHEVMGKGERTARVTLR